MPSSWLMKRHPPQWKVEKERALWWAVIRQASRDLAYGYDQLSLDAFEFLRDSGRWIATHVVGVDDREYCGEVAELVAKRKRLRDTL